MSHNHIRGLCLTLLISVSAALAAPHKVRVGDPELAGNLIARGGKLIADYGDFQIIETDSDPAIRTGSSRAELADDLDVIQLNAGRLNSRRAEVQAQRKAVAPFSGKRLHLVHFAGPVKSEWLKALEQSGVQVVGHIPRNAYLVYGSAAALGRLQSWARTSSYVQWEGSFADDYKIHPRARPAAGKSNEPKAATDLFAVQLVDDANANPATLMLIDQLKLQPVRRDFSLAHYRNVIVRLPPEQLTRIAAQPDVVSIQPYFEPRKLDERQDQIIAGNLTGNSPTGPGYLEWLTGKGFSQSQFDASGFVVDVTDSGIENGTNLPGHFGLYTLGHPALASRVAYSRLEGTPNTGSTLLACDGHGNLNAHVIAGYSTFTGFPFADTSGFSYGLGVCPFVKVGASVIFDTDNFTDPNYVNLQADAYHDGARISANSWGDVYSGGLYDVDAQTYDILVRDAQTADSTYPTAGNQEMVIVFAAGNGGPLGGTINSPGCAKNVITVGASENVRSLSTTNGGNDEYGNDGCNVADVTADSANDLAEFSSRGPCGDGRLKPDLVAPGSHITGGVAQSGTLTNGMGVALGCFNASGVTALPGGGTQCGSDYAMVGNTNNYFPLGQEFYTVSSGTSHATPAVAGACALLRQNFINHSLAPPSPAMTKACLLNSARYLDGAGANDTLWSTNQGMGGLNLGMAFDGVPRILRDQVPTNKFTGTGQTRTIVGMIDDPAKPLRVTLAWTDAFGTTYGAAYNNDLDLTVFVGGTTYKGNVFAGAFSVAGGGYDAKNNVESVFLPAGLSGSFMIKVTAADINSDGVPNEAPSLDQDFALVAYNALEAAAPVLALESSSLISGNSVPTNSCIDAGETVAVAFALQNIGSANATNLQVTLLATNGVFLPDGPRTYGVIAVGGGVVTQAFTFTAIGICGNRISPVLQLHDGTIDLGRVSASFTLGTSTFTSHSFTNTTYIGIPGSGTAGVGAPYPSSIVVSGVPGVVSKVTATLVGLNHTYAPDVGVLLVGPTGTNVVLVSYCGGTNPFDDLTLTFDDSAASLLPNTEQITSGTYKPSNYDIPESSFLPPAPPFFYGPALSAFNETNPNGTWSLYAEDRLGSDVGYLASGWRLSITCSNNVCSPAPPVLAPGMVSNGIITLTWSATPGQTYRVECSQNLGGTSWTNLAPDVTATNFLASRTDPVNSTVQRFYRVLVVP
jgi:hypothetical protein